jgi:hypothetical protein
MITTKYYKVSILLRIAARFINILLQRKYYVIYNTQERPRPGL